MMKREIVFPEDTFRRVEGHMLKEGPKEGFAFLLCGHSSTRNSFRLLVREVVLAGREELEYQHGTGVCPKKGFQVEVYERCYREGLDLIDVHSHPFAGEEVRFSPLDDASELGTSGREGTFQYLARKLPGVHLGSMVFGRKGLDARMYDPGRRRALPVDGVKVMGERMEIVLPTSSQEKARKLDLSRYSRQVLAFGELGQRRLAGTKVGVVGAGGLGSVVVEALARLGIGGIVCVDEDAVEESNISRMLGSFPRSVGKGKVEVIGRHLRRINPKLKFEGIYGSVLDPEVLKKLRDVDVLVCGTDTQSSRLVLNSFSVQYLIPLIDLGSEIVVEDGRIARAGGRVRLVVPGRRCLACFPGEIDWEEVEMELASPFERRRQVELGYVRGAEIPDPSVIFLNMTVASLGICELLNFLVGFKEPSHYVAYYLLESKVTDVKIGPANDDCPVCGRKGILALGDHEPLRDVREKGPLSSVPEAS